MHISKISRIPKTIWGILAAISTAVFGFILLSSVWFWICWEVVASALVAIGCFGEWYLFKTPATPSDEDCHRGKELHFILVVAIGVAMELIGLSRSIPEAIRLEGDVAKANLHIEELRQENLKLYAQIKPRRITPDQRTILLARLKNRFSGQPRVNIVADSGDMEQRILSRQIRDVLTECGFKIGFFEVLTVPNSPGDVVSPLNFGIAFVFDHAMPPHAPNTLQAFKDAGLVPQSMLLQKGAVPFIDENTLVIQIFNKPMG